MFWVPLLLLAWAIAGVVGVRLCRAAVREAAAAGDGAGERRGLTLYEAAFLSGGPARVADLTLVAMARQRRCCSRTPAGPPSSTRAGGTTWSAR